MMRARDQKQGRNMLPFLSLIFCEDDVRFFSHKKEKMIGLGACVLKGLVS